MPIGELPGKKELNNVTEKIKPEQTFFIHPDQDLKEFASEEVQYSEFRN